MTIITVKTGGIAADAVTDAKIADDVVGTEHLTANEVDTAALGADAVTAAQIADDAISEEHLDVTAITGHTAETSVADGDLVLIHDASASALRKMTKANFVSGIGGANTPAFMAELSSVQNTTDASATKIQFNTEIYDSGNVYDNSTNYRFTPGVAGKYFIFSGLTVFGSVAFTVGESYFYLYKNGSAYGAEQHYEFQSEKHGSASFHMGRVLVLDDDDYIEMFLNCDVTSGNPQVMGAASGTNNSTYFGAYKLIT